MLAVSPSLSVGVALSWGALTGALTSLCLMFGTMMSQGFVRVPARVFALLGCFSFLSMMVAVTMLRDDVGSASLSFSDCVVRLGRSSSDCLVCMVAALRSRASLESSPSAAVSFVGRTCRWSSCCETARDPRVGAFRTARLVSVGWLPLPVLGL